MPGKTLTEKTPDSGKPRARDLGLDFNGRTGPNNALTDVPGVLIGYTTLVAGAGPLKPSTAAGSKARGRITR